MWEVVAIYRRYPGVVVGRTKKTDSATSNDGRLRLGASVAGDTTGDGERGEDVGGEFEALLRSCDCDC